MISASIKTGLMAIALTTAFAGQAQATKYVGTFSGATPTGWTDTSGLFGSAGAVFSGTNFSGNFTYDTVDYTTNPHFPPNVPQFDAQGAATPGYSVSITLNGITVAQPDASSYYNPYLSNTGALTYDIGGWNGYFFLEVSTDVATTTGIGITPAMVTSGLMPSFTLTGSQLVDQNNNFVILDNGAQTGGLANLPLSSFSLTALPAVPEPSTWGMMLIGLGTIGFAARRRRTVRVTYA